MDPDQLLERINNMFNRGSKQFSIIQEKIDLPMQLEYFEFSRKVGGEITVADIPEKKDRLLNIETTIHEKKTILVQLALIEDPLAFRAIEAYVGKPDIELEMWAKMALNENRMLLESGLLDETQVFISTGLGGKGMLLRYFVVLTSKTGESFTETQCKIVRSEIEFALKNNQSKLEEINFQDNIATVLALIPLQIPVNNILTDALKECNIFGDFLSHNFLITNVRVLTFDEIKTFLNKGENPVESDLSIMQGFELDELDDADDEMDDDED